MSTISDIGAILSALMAQDPWMLKSAMRSDAMWVLGVLVALIGGGAIAFLYKRVPILDKHLERTFMVGSYLAIAFIIFWGVVDRFIF